MRRDGIDVWNNNLNKTLVESCKKALFLKR